jgi:uncharacterized protein (DUF433 family)
MPKMALLQRIFVGTAFMPSAADTQPCSNPEGTRSKKQMMVVNDRIKGKAHLKAEMVARMVVDGDASIQQTMEHYGLTEAEVHAALTYYYDNREELDRTHDAILAEIRANAPTLQSSKATLAARTQPDSK